MRLRRVTIPRASVPAVLAIAVLLVSCGTTHSPAARPFEWGDVLNAQVPAEGLALGQVTLRDGTYSAAAAPGSTTLLTVGLQDVHAAGDLNGDTVLDAVGVIVTDAGGRSKTASIVGFLAQRDGPVSTAAFPLPTGVIVDGLAIDEGQVDVSYATVTASDEEGDAGRKSTADSEGRETEEDETEEDETEGRDTEDGDPEIITGRGASAADEEPAINAHVLLRLDGDRLVEVDRSGNEPSSTPTEDIEATPLEVAPDETKTDDGTLEYRERARYSVRADANDRLEVRVTSTWDAVRLGVTAPDGNALLAPDVGKLDYLVEKAAAGDYLIDLIGRSGDPADYEVEVSRARPPAPKPPPPAADPAKAQASGEKVLYLTYDDGPDPRFTPKIVNLLGKYDAKATFFVVGQSLVEHRKIVQKAADAGHTIANHTWTHTSLAGMSREKFASEVGRTQRELGSLGTGCLRPPYGAQDESTAARAAEHGLAVKMWDVDTIDYRKPGANAIAERVLSQARPGAVVLMHDGGGDRSQTVAATEIILKQLTAKGYRFKALC